MRNPVAEVLEATVGSAFESLRHHFESLRRHFESLRRRCQP
jgi:hypothetical protein